MSAGGPRRPRATALTCCLLALVACGGAPPPTPSSPVAPSAVDAPAPPPADAPWEQIRDSDGIVIHRRVVPGSPLVAFKGEGLIEQPILRVAMVLLDPTRSHEWADRVVEARELGEVSAREVVHYSRVRGTWVTKDRDFVTRITLELEPGRLIRLRLRATEDPRAPVTEHVRGEILEGSFTLTAEGEARTRVTAELHVDPKGTIPTWMVNAFQRRWAYKTITALRRQSARTDLADVPAVRARLVAAGFFGDAPR